MAKKAYKCTSCGHIQPTWAGQCPVCKAIGTLDEVDANTIPGVRTGGTSGKGERAARAATGRAPQKISAVRAQTFERIPSGIGELDYVLGGGFVPGGVVLLAGNPGSGKSTLTNMIAKKLADQGKTSLLISGEETEAQIAARAERLNAVSDNIYLLAETNLDNAMAHVEALQPDFLVVDSLQALLSSASDSRMGSTGQVAEVATAVTSTAKRMGIPTIVIGQILKNDQIAGPRLVEHLVDVVLYFESADDSPIRMLRGVKNRYGNTEIGCFIHTETGLEEVTDPSGILLSQHEEGTDGYATSVFVEGQRAFPIEIQALVTTSPLPNPRKISHGLDHQRSVMVQAILDKYGRARIGEKDVYVSTTGGILAKDSSLDMAVAAAILSSYNDVPPPESSIFIGELTLTGEVRRARNAELRVREAKKLGFSNIYDEKRIKTVRDLAEMFKRS
jgi:DNA repair protein RadA/Sms